MNACRLISVLVVIGMLGATRAAAQNTWALAHKNPSNNAISAQLAQVRDLSGGAAWDSGDLVLVSGATPTLLHPLVFVPAVLEDGVTTPGIVLALDVMDGGVAWQSPGLERQVFGSAGSAVVDERERAVYYATGGTVYKLDAEDGSEIWATPLDGVNTDPAPAAYRFVNASPQLGRGMVFIETFGGFVPADKQIVALDQTTGDVVWFDNDGGQGQGTPVYLDAADGGRLYTSGQNSLRCRRASDGTRLWDSAVDTPTTWTTAPWVIFASVTHHEGKIYSVGADSAFAATTATLVCADAGTGDLDWQVDAPVSDVPPLVLDGKVYIYGGGFPGRMAAYDAATGASIFNVLVAPGEFIFRNYMAATHELIYITDGSNLLAVDPRDGAVLDRLGGDYTGGVSLDEFGVLYAHAASLGGPSSLQAFGDVTMSTPPSPTLTVIEPAGGETWVVGTQAQIQWQTDVPIAGTAVRLDLWDANGSVALLGYRWSPTGMETFTLPVPEVAGGSGYRVRATSTWNGSLWNQSNAPFTIVNNSAAADWAAYE